MKNAWIPWSLLIAFVCSGAWWGGVTPSSLQNTAWTFNQPLTLGSGLTVSSGDVTITLGDVDVLAGELATPSSRGVGAGAGSIEIVEADPGAFKIVITVPDLAADYTMRLTEPVDVGATCIDGTWSIDTGGATDEWCLCVGTDTWRCVALGAVTD